MTSSLKSSRRILIKLSGEALGGETQFGIEPAILSEMARSIIEIRNQGVQVALVIGGGNIFRGAALQKAGMDRTVGDHMGMLATVINGLAMRDELIRQGTHCVLMSAQGIASITEQYAAQNGREILEQGSVLIVAGGTGSPFFTTDTAAVLRAVELHCDEVLKGTKVDGVYSADPFKDPDAVLYKTLTYKEVLTKELQVMDLTAFALARDHEMKIRVFSMTREGALLNAATGGDEGTLIS
ncbi:MULTISPECIES: UMP kinase [unclassified Anaerobiospirillum]|uniref:UMP kinase n=1 Tax=unclassified Anaerobiospirillum TaxID=2647410 RepID=UPI001FF6A3F0|nr:MULTISPECIES: UMP kinase [unclassified Anaerobiospirillum]MCK0534669.1 UMP kinase [Anaerobiospirillum sp. NML120511]MCK0539925.1 UMP kinase [Anaerobiospirillum sp. NML02-A-032]